MSPSDRHALQTRLSHLKRIIRAHSMSWLWLWLYAAHIARHPLNGVPMHIVLIQNRLTKQVLTCGTFHFEAQAKRWALDTIKRRAWRNASELPDSL